jgi:hypothetical protein
MDSDSLRVDIASLAPNVGIAICDVNIVFPQERRKASRYTGIPELDALSDEQKEEHAALVRRKAHLTTCMAAIEKSASLLHGYADSLLRSFNIPAPGIATGTQVLDEVICAYPVKLEELLEKHHDTQDELEDVQRDISDLLEEGKQIRAKSNPDEEVSWFGPQAIVTVVLESDAARDVKVLVSYRTYLPNIFLRASHFA